MSLSNFRNFKIQQQHKPDDEYIEEDFEEDIPEVSEDSEEEKKQVEEVRQPVVQTSRVIGK